MLQIQRQGLVNNLSARQLSDYRGQWKKQRAILLPGLIEPELLRLLQGAISRGRFKAIKHGGVDATEQCLERDGTVLLMEMLASDPALTQVISEITDAGSIGCIPGRVYNISQSDHDDWHQDINSLYDYMMAMSINLSPRPYEGGSLCLRHVKTKKVFCDIQNIGPGDALLFDIDPELEHKISPVFGKNPKIAFAGWFCSKPTYEDYMNKMMRKVVKKSRLLSETGRDLNEKPDAVISPTVAYREVGKRALIVDLTQDSQTVLNSMGTRIWKGFAEKAPREKTIAGLKQAYELDDATAMMEFKEFRADLYQLGLIQ